MSKKQQKQSPVTPIPDVEEEVLGTRVKQAVFKTPVYNKTILHEDGYNELRYSADFICFEEKGVGTVFVPMDNVAWWVA